MRVARAALTSTYKQLRAALLHIRALAKTLAARSMPQYLETYNNQAAVDLRSVQLYSLRQQNQIETIASAIAGFCQAAHISAAFCKTTLHSAAT